MKRQTLQKTVILQELTRLGGHRTPSEVYEALHENYPTISRATVFRVLSDLSEDGRAQKVVTLGAMRYECGNRPHYHAICRGCNKLTDVTLEYFDGIEAKVKSMDDFKIEGHYLGFIGLCSECQATLGENGENKMKCEEINDGTQGLENRS